jgi:zinc transporter
MNLDPFAIEVLISDQFRPQCHSISSGLLIVLYGVNVDLMASYEDMVSLRMWINEERLLGFDSA